MSRSERLRLIVSLSIPSILAQISATVMFFIDASMVGHLGERASAAIGIVETTGWLMGGLAMAANMGFSVQVAHFIGANDFEAARRVLRQSLVCCMLWSLLISIVALCIAFPLPYWLGGSEDIAHDASVYFLRHLLPNGRTGRLDAEMLRQHEDTLYAQHRHVPDGCGIQLFLHLCTRAWCEGRSDGYWLSRAYHCHSHALFPVGTVRDAGHL